MLGKLWDMLSRKPEPEPVEVEPEQQDELAPEERTSFLNGNIPGVDKYDLGRRLAQFAANTPQAQGVAMDDDGTTAEKIKGAFTRGQPGMSDELTAWYASQSFIGHQLCALIAQHWLIFKVCAMPARDAVRNWFTVTSATGEEIDAQTMRKIELGNRRYGLKRKAKEFITKGRIFGVRIAIFNVRYDNPAAAYEAPFNLDGVSPGSYIGISQVDPYWCAPLLDYSASTNPRDPHFFEPTWWTINGVKYHRSHLIIYRHGELADILKPAYLYGGIPVPQQIMERVYAAERTANEAPLLTLTKRTSIFKTATDKVVLKFKQFAEKMEVFTKYWNNTGIRVIDTSEAHEQFDTALADLDSVIMTQYQLVSAVGEVPATKLMGTQPKGFNATGEFDEASYHETLESIQEHDISPLVERHMQIMAKSMELEVSDLIATWNPLDVPTEEELANTNLTKAQTASAYVAAGVTDAVVEQQRLMQDKNSGYAGVLASMSADVETDF